MDAVVHLYRNVEALQQALHVAGAIGLELHRILAASHEVDALHGGHLVDAVGQGLPVLHGGQIQEGTVLQAEIGAAAGNGFHDRVDLLGWFAVLLELQFQGCAVHAHPAAEFRLSWGEPLELVRQIHLADRLQLRHALGHEGINRILTGQVHMALADSKTRRTQGIKHMAFGSGIP